MPHPITIFFFTNPLKNIKIILPLGLPLAPVLIPCCDVSSTSAATLVSLLFRECARLPPTPAALVPLGRCFPASPEYLLCTCWLHLAFCHVSASFTSPAKRLPSVPLFLLPNTAPYVLRICTLSLLSEAVGSMKAGMLSAFTHDHAPRPGTRLLAGLQGIFVNRRQS